MIAGLLCLSLVCGGLTPLFATTPMEQLKETIERVVAILQDSNGGPPQVPARRESLRHALARRFDFVEMARISLGHYWLRESSRQNEFVSAFTAFVESSYLQQVEALKDHKVVYVGEHVGRSLARVDTKIVPRWSDSVSVNYKLHHVGGEWKIYDVQVDDISLVDNYRSQFSRFLAVASFDELLKRLQGKKAPQEN